MDFIDRNLKRNKQLTIVYKYVLPIICTLLIMIVVPILNNMSFFFAFVPRIFLSLFISFLFYIQTIDIKQLKIAGITDKKYENEVNAFGVIVGVFSWVFMIAMLGMFLYAFLQLNIVISFLMAAIIGCILIQKTITGLPDPYWNE